MSSLVKKVKPDRSKIDAGNAKELRYWTKALNASNDEVLSAIEKVGNSAAAVRKELAGRQPLQPGDFPVRAEGKKIKRQDGTAIAETPDPALATDIADRLNQDEGQSEEDKWSA